MPVTLEQQGDYWVARFDPFNLVISRNTEDEAMEQLCEALRDFVNLMYDRGRLRGYLEHVKHVGLEGGTR